MQTAETHVRFYMTFSRNTEKGKDVVHFPSAFLRYITPLVISVCSTTRRRVRHIRSAGDI